MARPNASHHASGCTSVPSGWSARPCRSSTPVCRSRTTTLTDWVEESTPTTLGMAGNVRRSRVVRSHAHPERGSVATRSVSQDDAVVPPARCMPPDDRPADRCARRPHGIPPTPPVDDFAHSRAGCKHVPSELTRPVRSARGPPQRRCGHGLGPPDRVASPDPDPEPPGPPRFPEPGPACPCRRTRQVLRVGPPLPDRHRVRGAAPRRRRPTRTVVPPLGNVVSIPLSQRAQRQIPRQPVR